MDKILHSHRLKFLRQRIVELRKAKLSALDILNTINTENLERCDPPIEQTQIDSLIKESNLVEDSQKNQVKYTDRDNAIYFKNMFDNELFYCEKLNGWWYWAEKKWENDQLNLIGSYAGKALDKMKVEAQASGNEKHYKWVANSNSKGKIEAMISLARGEGMSKPPDIVDKDDLLLNCQNGTLDLRDFTLKPHSPYDYITKITGTNYIPGAPKEKWIKFLNDIFLEDQELIDYMQKVCGYALSGLSREQCMWVLYGNGMNGKTKFVTALEKVIGDYHNALDPRELIIRQNDGIGNEIARLNAARFITTSESGQSKLLDEAKVKRITGEEKMSARFLYCESFEFYFKGKIFFSTNHKPEVRGYDKGIWRRIRPIPFDMVLTEEQVDRDILEKLMEEKEGILDWCVEGFRKYKEEGLKNPKRVEDALTEYKEESDKFAEFIDENCLFDEENEVSSSELLHAANNWAKDLGFRINRNVFRDYLKKKGFVLERKTRGYFWIGIKLKEQNVTKDEWQFSESQRPF